MTAGGDHLRQDGGRVGMCTLHNSSSTSPTRPGARDFYRHVLTDEPVLDVPGMTEFDLGSRAVP
jgi:hypothetical protein